MVELPELKQEKKVKSMQMFKKAAQRAVQGDRVGICLTQLDAKLVERGLLAEVAHPPPPPVLLHKSRCSPLDCMEWSHAERCIAQLARLLLAAGL